MADTFHPEPKQHHFVHRAYLEGFVDPDYQRRGESYLWAYLPGKSPFRQKPERIAKRNYYYCFQHEEKRRFDFEHTLQSLEDVSLPVLRKFRSLQFNIDPEERLTFAGYIGLSYARVPTFERNINRFTELYYAFRVEEFASKIENLELMACEESERTGKPVSPDEIRSRLNGGTAIVKQESREWSLKQTMQFTMLLQQILFNMRWTFLVAADEDSGFITSDNPVALFNTSTASLPGVGFAGNPNTYLTFPVSRNICLLAKHSSGARQAIMRVGGARVREVNKGTINRADSQLYAPFQSQKIQELHDLALSARRPPTRVLMKKGRIIEE